MLFWLEGCCISVSSGWVVSSGAFANMDVGDELTWMYSQRAPEEATQLLPSQEPLLNHRTALALNPRNLRNLWIAPALALNPSNLWGISPTTPQHDK